jgi:CxxC-x17-CxxC domain-containing protein
MANFNRENQSGGYRNFNKARFTNDRQEMHKATCDKCGNSCEVPFRPTGSKPVFCRDCFRKNEGFDSRGSEDRTFGRSHSEERQMYDAVCSRCGSSCKIPFRPSSGREIFCSRCFENNGAADSRRPERRSFDKPRFNQDDTQQRTHDASNYKAQFDELNAKIDKILHLLTPTPIAVAPVEAVTGEHGEEMQEKKEEIVVKTAKKVKALSTKPTAKAKKTTSAKKE